MNVQILPQAHYHIIKGQYPCRELNILGHLAALYLQFTEGDFLDEKETIGKISKLIPRLFPPYFIGENKPSDLRNAVIESYALLNGVSQAECALQYIRTCHKFDFYGSVFFHGILISSFEQNKVQDSRGRKSLPASSTDVWIACNNTSVHIIRKDDSIVEDFIPFKYLASFTTNSSTDLFVMAVDDYTKKRQIIISTPQGLTFVLSTKSFLCKPVCEFESTTKQKKAEDDLIELEQPTNNNEIINNKSFKDMLEIPIKTNSVQPKFKNSNNASIEIVDLVSDTELEDDDFFQEIPTSYIHVHIAQTIQTELLKRGQKFKRYSQV
ncbi:hypothetical protein ROZALSC1DRAFT_21114 [Rozella allomycis CSF55]|uniref:FERM domain-containing protein n=1 Tax=Rozella allomycis (strain CSF55) TaxID=988480 RepID=A0A4P9YNC6_ROZAC|nr:hypothetical protein ROZALSC1DRAFT_21114 [Rozella allomycis CSF55]